MVPTAALWSIVEREGIAVEWSSVVPVPALYLRKPDWSSPVIVLRADVECRERTLRTLLAHELGHHFTAAGDWIRFRCVDGFSVARVERLANIWAARFLLPADLLESNARAGTDPAEENLVEPWLVDFAVKMYWPLRAA